MVTVVGRTQALNQSGSYRSGRVEEAPVGGVEEEAEDEEQERGRRRQQR
jgi:hypothetical protein